jgi:NAD/NADP transhydrogenase alpha subunit
MVAFETTGGGGHITTVVSGSGASAMLVDNITYMNGNGSIANSANDGSASDIIVAPPHPAMQEFSGVDPSMAVVYELDTPVVSDVVSSVMIAEQGSLGLDGLFTAHNPLADL